MLLIFDETLRLFENWNGIMSSFEGTRNSFPLGISTIRISWIAYKLFKHLNLWQTNYFHHLYPVINSYKVIMTS